MEDLIIWRRISLFNQLYWFAKKRSGISTRNVESITSNNVEVEGGLITPFKNELLSDQ